MFAWDLFKRTQFIGLAANVEKKRIDARHNTQRFKRAKARGD